MGLFTNHLKLWLGILIAIAFGVWAMWGEWKHADAVKLLGAVAALVSGYVFDKRSEKKREKQTKSITAHVDQQVVTRLEAIDARLQQFAPKENDDQIIAEIGKTLTEAGRAVEGQVRAARGAMYKGEFAEAERLYEHLSRLFPDVADLHFNLGYVRGMLGKNDEAIAAYNAALLIKPDYHEAQNDKGVILDVLGRHEEAIAAYDAALRIKPDDHEMHFNKGISLGELGRHQEAIAAYDEALRIKPNDHESHNNRGASLGQLYRFDEAILAYDAALRLKPDLHQAHYNRALTCAATRKKVEALMSLKSACELFEPCKTMAEENPAFAPYHSDPEFRKIVGLD